MSIDTTGGWSLEKVANRQTTASLRMAPPVSDNKPEVGPTFAKGGPPRGLYRPLDFPCHPRDLAQLTDRAPDQSSLNAQQPRRGLTEI